MFLESTGDDMKNCPSVSADANKWSDRGLDFASATLFADGGGRRRPTNSLVDEMRTRSVRE
jgi:hypothetical protein